MKGVSVANGVSAANLGSLQLGYELLRALALRLVGALRWLGGRKAELVVLGIGVLLRLSMIWNFHPYWSYDSDPHWEVVSWILQHGTIPTPEQSFEAFHPPLFYLVSAWFVRHGFARETLVWISVAYGVVRLGLIWVGLELCLPRWRLARVVALGLAATLSASVHLDGMAYPEALNCLLSTAAMQTSFMALRSSGARRVWLTLLTGLLLGLDLLTKVSAAAVILAVFTAAGCELLFSRQPWRERLKRAATWGGALALCLAVSGWYYARNIEKYGGPFVCSFDLPTQSYAMNGYKDTRPIDRRTLGYVLAWSDEPYKWPHYPAALFIHTRFFPLAVAASVVDYWEYSYEGYEKAFSLDMNRPKRTLWKVQDSARLAVAGGTVVFFAVVAAWLVSAKVLAQQRDFARLALLFVPLCTLLATLQWTTNYPIDGLGVVKGIYMNFSAPPFYALFGLAAAWAQQRPTRWPLLGLFLFALVLIANYSFSCRLGLPLLVS